MKACIACLRLAEDKPYFSRTASRTRLEMVVPCWRERRGKVFQMLSFKYSCVRRMRYSIHHVAAGGAETSEEALSSKQRRPVECRCIQEIDGCHSICRWCRRQCG